MSTRILLGLLAVLLATQAVAASLTPEETYQAAEKRLAKHSDSFWLDGTPEGREALDAYWAAAQDWTVWYLNNHTQMAAKDISEHLKTQVLNRGASVGVEKVGPDLYAASADFGEIGNVFLVAKRNGRFAVVWDIRHAAAADTARFPAIAAWSTDHARDPCPAETKGDQSRADSCGPIHGSIRLLPPDASGQIRFYIAATYAQMASETVGGQLSIWNWNGRIAKPLLVKTYTYTLEDSGVYLKGPLLTVRVKDEYKMYFSAGCCAGRQLDWTIRISPDRIDDLGMIPLIPELDAIDDLLFRIWHRLPADAIAAPKVVTILTSIMKAEEASGEFDPGFLSFGMFMGSSVQRGPRSTLVCLGTDNDDAPLLAFRMKHTKKGYFLTDVTRVSEGAKCPVHIAGAE